MNFKRSKVSFFSAFFFGISLFSADARGGKGFFCNNMLHEWLYTHDAIQVLKGYNDSAAGTGDIVAKGDFPHGGLSGDLSIVLNGKRIDLPLLSLEEFTRKLENGGILDYASDGVAAEVDFGKGKWKASIEGNSYDERFTPERGIIDASLIAGGVEVYSERIFIGNHSSSLTIRK
ncbi:MAG TPA: hypothetical protein PK747_05615 [Acidobacteriota bacterium]|nr:hypothetical protein [Acidobacteriota bacterium]HNT17454.1 hypothetical protein [Acidobacteriota bacterium]HPA26190.1 hypothetical protein [Acidobacteriota bacterium]HQO18748.1 hypothetical protein [Acidobacteriota bacterium]HQQ46873.1 hypothetical protein [Acidobacteriota bacterium]